jgi:DNA-binding CsgD family transcriptional regulator
MKRLSIEQLAKVMDSATEKELTSNIQALATQIGFETHMLGVQVNRALIAPVQHVASNYGKNWQRIYQARQYVAKDPTVAHCQTHTTPLVWSEGMYTPESRDLWEDARSHGLAYGVSVPVHERMGLKSMFSFASDRPFDGSPGQQKSMVTNARTLATCAHFAVSRLIVPELVAQTDPTLSAREREILIWAAKGKTSSEIGQILNVTEGTATFHLKNVIEKFNVSNRAQAIAVGVAMGLVY